MDWKKKYSKFFTKKIVIKLDRIQVDKNVKSNISTELRITRSKKEVKTTEWARVLNGHYKGDLAHIESIDSNRDICSITLVPRINYVALASNFNECSTKRRPNPKPFDIDLIR